MKIKAAIASILALFAVASASAQQFPTVPDRTVIGRIGVGGQSGPSQAIPFATLTSQIFSLAPTVPVFHPSSGNLNGPGCDPSSTTFWNTAENICGTGDVWQLTSTDPSAGFVLTLTGTVTVGDSISLTITMGSGLCSGAGCTVTSGAAIGGDTLQSLANKIVCSIANNASLFNLGNGSCIGPAGVVSSSGSKSWGGYASGNPIGHVVLITNGLTFDFNSTISLKVTSSVSGSATEVVTIANTTCGTRCSYPLDNNPAIYLRRQAGIAPQPGSTLAAIYAIGATSGCPTTLCANYGVIANWVGNSTAGGTQAAWLMQSINTSGALAGGVWFGQGMYSNSGGAPFSSTAMQDKGAGTLNLATCLWLNSTSVRDATATDSICQASGQLQITATGTDNMVLSSSTGIGVNATPTGSAFVSALGGFFSGPQVPTTGQGISLVGGAVPVLSSRDYGGAANLPLSVISTGVTVNNNAAPASPAAGFGTYWYDSTDLRFHDKNSAGAIGTTVVANTGAANNFLTSISAAGVVARAQPTIGNLANIANNTIVGNQSGGSGPPLALTVAQASAMFTKPTAPTPLTSGTNATYTTPANATWLEVEMVGGGGGGGGSGTTPGAATAGGNTCWNTSGTACTTPLYQATGGALGTTAGGNAAGGGVAGSLTCNDSQVGGTGGGSSGVLPNLGGSGGVSRYGGAVATNPVSSAGTAAVANTGGGGSGAGSSATANSGGGGGAGGWCYFILINPAATYVYTIAAAGAAGTAGTGGLVGGAGATGKIRVIEHYN